MAFQLVDDVPISPREKTLGKPVGGDLREGKATLPLVYALECASPGERGLVVNTLCPIQACLALSQTGVMVKSSTP